MTITTAPQALGLCAEALPMLDRLETVHAAFMAAPVDKENFDQLFTLARLKLDLHDLLSQLVQGVDFTEILPEKIDAVRTLLQATADLAAQD